VRFPDPSSRLSDVDGVRLGHWTDRLARTGCTVVMFDRQRPASVHVAGGAPGTQETDLLDPSCLVGGVDAILLAGGSAFGLEAASGVRAYLESKQRGFRAGAALVPIVPAAVIFDLGVGDAIKRPGKDEGFAACLDAEKAGRGEGAVGAGTGATVGKYLGPDSHANGGVASRCMEIGGGARIGAVMVANCYGAVIDPARGGRVIAGPVDGDGARTGYFDDAWPAPAFGATAIGVVVTDARLTKADARRVAIMAHDGLARCVVPSHTPYDGDAIFVVSTGAKELEIARLGAWAAFMVERAMIAAVER